MSRFRLLQSQAGDTVASLLLVVLAILVYHWAADFPQGKGETLGPDFFPKVLAVAVGLLAMLMMVESLLMKKKPETETRRNYLLTAFVAALLLAYVLILPGAGFVASTTLFLTASVYTLRRKHFLMIALISLLFTVSIFFAFKMVLKVPLP